MTFNINNLLYDRSGIYSITSSIDKRIYIGSSVNFWRRYTDHKNRLKKKIHANKYLQAFVNKYGIGSLSFNLICICKNTCLVYNEQRVIKQFDANNPRNGFNLKRIVNRPYFEDQFLFDLRNMKTPLQMMFPNGIPGVSRERAPEDDYLFTKEWRESLPKYIEEKKTPKVVLSRWEKIRKKQLLEIIKQLRASK